MFEKTLADKLARIFRVKKVSYSAPGDASEQECLFIFVESCLGQAKQGQYIAKVMGTFGMFANADKMPFGYFDKKIQEADPSDTTDLFFYNTDRNERIYQNIVERRCSFVYFYRGDYNPDAGSLDSITFTYEVEE